MTGEDHPPGNRFDEVADAATRAFRLLPAPPQDVMTCGRADRRRLSGSPPTPTRWNEI